MKNLFALIEVENMNEYKKAAPKGRRPIGTT